MLMVCIYATARGETMMNCDISIHTLVLLLSQTAHDDVPLILNDVHITCTALWNEAVMVISLWKIVCRIRLY